MMGSLLREWTERKADADDARGIVAGASRGVNRTAGFELDTSSRIRCPGMQVGRAAAVEAGGLALLEAAWAHDVGGALGAAGVARVRETGGQRQHVAQGGDVAADGRHGRAGSNR
jgi:hypothetical protein